MANFSPLNNYMLYVFDKLILKYGLKPPFLDAGCGSGYASKYLALKGWKGKAIDLSAEAIKLSQKELSSFQNVKVTQEGILSQKENFNTIILFDVIEHIEDDEKMLRKTNQLLNSRGNLILALTSNPKEWRWDDEFYGHFRRYTEDDIRKKLIKAGFEPKEFIESTFPIFWFIRRLYTSLVKPPEMDFRDKGKRTNASATSTAWKISGLFNILIKLSFLWELVFFIQYIFFKRFTSYGFGMLVVAQKSTKF